MLSKTTNDKSMASTPGEPLHPRVVKLRDFAGKWCLTRKIVQSNGDEFVFEGQANFTWQKSLLRYTETGMVTAPNGKKLQAERRYFWQQGESKQIDVYFEDNRYFHTFSNAAPYAEHICGNDVYTVSYCLNRWPLWQSSWQVTGPRKDYRMISQYQPD